MTEKCRNNNNINNSDNPLTSRRIDGGKNPFPQKKGVEILSWEDVQYINTIELGYYGTWTGDYSSVA